MKTLITILIVSLTATISMAQITTSTPVVNGTTTVKPSKKPVHATLSPERKAELQKKMLEFQKMTPEQKKEVRAKWQKENEKRKANNSKGSKMFKYMTPEERKEFLEKNKTQK